MVITGPDDRAPPNPGRFGATTVRPDTTAIWGSHIEASIGCAWISSSPSAITKLLSIRTRCGTLSDRRGRHDRQRPRHHRERGGEAAESFAVAVDLERP